MRQRLRRNLLSRQGRVMAHCRLRPLHPLHDGVVFSPRPSSSGTRRNHYDAAGALACARRRSDVIRCNGICIFGSLCANMTSSISQRRQRRTIHIGWSDVTESMVTTRSPFCDYKMPWCVELNGEYLSCYSNKIKSVNSRNCPRDHWLANKAYLSAFTVTNICQRFTYKTAAKINWYRQGNKITSMSPHVYNTHEQYGEYRTCSSGDILADKHRHAHYNTPFPLPTVGWCNYDNRLMYVEVTASPCVFWDCNVLSISK